MFARWKIRKKTISKNVTRFDKQHSIRLSVSILFAHASTHLPTMIYVTQVSLTFFNSILEMGIDFIEAPHFIDSFFFPGVADLLACCE